MSADIKASILGFPRMGSQRQLKVALEQYWAGKIDAQSLLATAEQLRQSHWSLLKGKGLDVIPSNDFSFYDQFLDAAILLNAVPKSHEIMRSADSTDIHQFPLYFSLARGFQGVSNGTTVDLQALEMKKWFDTNYHYLVPELEEGQVYNISANNKPLREFNEAKALGIPTRPVIIGPLTFVYLSKINGQMASSVSVHTILNFLEKIIPAYVQLFTELSNAGANWIQVDEPCLVLDLPNYVKDAFKSTYALIHEKLGQVNTTVRLLLATYFEDIRENLALVLDLPIHGVHLDLVRAPQQADSVLQIIKQRPFPLALLSLGVVEGRNVWRSNMSNILQTVKPIIEAIAQSNASAEVLISSSCSLLHAPHSLELETKLPTEIKQWLTFATEKVDEVTLISRVLNGTANEQDKIALAENDKAVANRLSSSAIHIPSVKQAVNGITVDMKKRNAPFPVRAQLQQDILHLPLFPTTTIGSFPQTQHIRSLRAKFVAKKITQEEYDYEIKEETRKAILKQEEIGLDVLVPAEYERNDMVEFFAQQLDGFVSTSFGWVQSYGSRCVKPAILFGDVRRTKPMIVEMSKYAASLTSKPMKAVLTGPVTILQWTFVRNDQPRSVTAAQLALAIREEVKDLESAGMKIIQIDEAAIREGLPLQKAAWDHYLTWAIDAFLLSSCVVKNATQVHSHMCYSDFQDILPAIARMDCDALTIENARSSLKLIQAFANFSYPNMIGPGLYDIHSPRIPTVNEMSERLKVILEYIKADQLWVNPDCGLKTRRWEEVEKALTNLVEVARVARAAHKIVQK